MTTETLEYMGVTYLAEDGHAVSRKGRAWAVKACRELKRAGVAAFPRPQAAGYFAVQIVPPGADAKALEAEAVEADAERRAATREWAARVGAEMMEENRRRAGTDAGT